MQVRESWYPKHHSDTNIAFRQLYKMRMLPFPTPVYRTGLKIFIQVDWIKDRHHGATVPLYPLIPHSWAFAYLAASYPVRTYS